MYHLVPEAAKQCLGTSFLGYHSTTVRYTAVTAIPNASTPAAAVCCRPLSHQAYNLTNSCFSLNGAASTCFPGEYQTDLIATKARGQIE